jgi:hypothetical protein
MTTDEAPPGSQEQREQVSSPRVLPQAPKVLPQEIVSARTGKNGLGVSSFVLGLLTVITNLAGFINVFVVIPGIVGLCLGLAQRRRLRTGEATNRSITNAGIVLSAIGIVVSLAMIIAILLA